MLDELKTLAAGMKHPVSELATIAGMSKSYMSEVWAGKKPVTDNLLRIIRRKISEKSEQLESGGSPPITHAETNRLMVESNHKLADSVHIIAKTNADLAAMLKAAQAIGHEPLGIPEALLPRFLDVLHLIAKAGTTGWKSEKEALAELNKSFYAYLSRTKKAKDSRASAGTLNK